MKSKIRVLADGAVNILFMLVAVYLICSVSYQNRHLSVPVKWLMWGMVALAAADGILYIAGSWRDNVSMRKIIRGFAWAVTICACGFRGCLVLFLIALVLFVYMSGPKRKVFDFPYTGMVICVCMEVLSLAGILLGSEYPRVGRLLLNSLAVDVLFILAVICYMNAEKVTALITKLPSLEKTPEMEYFGTDSREEEERNQGKAALGILLFGGFLGLYVYSGTFVCGGFLQILVCIAAVILQIGLLYAVYRDVFPELSGADVWLVSVGAVCLPYAGSRNFDKMAILGGIAAFVLFGSISRLLRKYKFRWVAACAVQVAVMVFFYLQGICIVPLASIVVGIVLGKLVSRKYCVVAALCALFVVCGAAVAGAAYIVPEASYHERAEFLASLEKDTGASLCYLGDNADFEDAMHFEGITLQTMEERTDACIEIYDASVDMLQIASTYCLLSDDDYWIVTRSADVAERYAEDGGSYYKIEAETEISITADGTQIGFEISGVPEAYLAVSVGVWSTANLSDIEWIPLTKKETGIYTGEFDIEGYEGDTVYMHVYGNLADGTNDFLGNTEYSVIR